MRVVIHWRVPHALNVADYGWSSDGGCCGDRWETTCGWTDATEMFLLVVSMEDCIANVFHGMLSYHFCSETHPD